MFSEDARTALEADLVGWLTTVTSEGHPQSSAVWFVLDGDDLVVYSGSDSTRLENLAANRHVAFNLRGDRAGDHVVTVEGTASIDGDLPAPNEPGSAYLEKYESEMIRLGWTPETFASDFPVGLRIHVARVRSW